MSIYYDVDTENQKVTAKFLFTKYDAIDKIRKISNRTPVLFRYDFERERYMMADTYSATVTCHAPDVFNVEEGKRLAKEKLKKHYMAAMNRRLHKFMFDLQQLEDKTFSNLFREPY